MKIINIALYDLKKMLRDKASLVMVLALPLVFTFMMGLVFANAGSDGAAVLPVAITNYDKGDLTKQLLDEAGKDKTISISQMSEKELYDKVKGAEVEVGFIIPGDFSKKVREGKTPELKVVKLPSSASFQVAETTINTALTTLRVREGTRAYFGEKMTGADETQKEFILTEIGNKLEDNLKKPDLIAVDESVYGSRDSSAPIFGTAQSTIGIALMFLMFTIMLGGAGSILEERKINTWDRLGITPTGKAQIMAGKIVGTFLKAWFQAAILILFGKYVMGVNWGNSMLSVAIVISIYIFCGMCIGLFFASLVRTNSQLSAISAVMIVSTSMLGGCYWPLDMTPPAMQKVGAFLPQYWAMKGLKGVVVGNLGLDSILKPVLILALMGVLFFILSVAAQKFKGFKRIGKKAPQVAAEG